MWTLVGEDWGVSPPKSPFVEGNQDVCVFNVCKDDRCTHYHDQLATHQRLRTHRNGFRVGRNWQQS